MRFFLLLCLFALSHSSPLTEPEITTFEQFKAVFGKVYATPEEESIRRANFEASLKWIQENDRKDGGAHLAVNQFADLGANESVGVNLTARRGEAFFEAVTIHVTPEGNLPETFDWRSKLGPIENQGRCGACWAFASLATVEAAFAIKYNTHIRLSKQELVECTRESDHTPYENSGCQGGYSWEALKYVQVTGVVEEAAYPYEAKDNQACYDSHLRSEKRYHINAFHRLQMAAPDESIMTVLKTHGPVAVDIDADHNGFKHYKSGVIRLTRGGTTEVNHVINIVGWGRENGLDYWLIRNSWGTHWGEAGYGKVERHHNNMGINHFVSFPVFH
uniref:Aca s 1 allergen n=1 Tax=Acarus siro TaxID=66546 RepID=A7UNU3_ACASI|nr:Aca s 1 allergen [Acarus siro]